MNMNLICFEKCQFSVDFDNIFEWIIPSLLLFKHSVAECIIFPSMSCPYMLCFVKWYFLYQNDLGQMLCIHPWYLIVEVNVRSDSE